MYDDDERLTPEEALRQLQNIVEAGRAFHTPESAHIEADGILVALLRHLGHDDIVKAYDAVEPKWFS